MLPHDSHIQPARSTHHAGPVGGRARTGAVVARYAFRDAITNRQLGTCAITLADVHRHGSAQRAANASAVDYGAQVFAVPTRGGV